MVRSIKKPTKIKIKKYKSKKKDRKRKTMKKKNFARRTFKKKVKKQRGGSNQSPPAGAQTPNYRPFEEFSNDDKWEQPNSDDTIAHFLKVVLDIDHDFRKFLPTNYAEICIELIEKFPHHNDVANSKYYDLLIEWGNLPKTTKERFLLLHCLSILDPTLLESALSMYKIKIGDGEPDITLLKGPGADKLFLNDLYFITDAFGSSSVFKALIDRIGRDQDIQLQPDPVIQPITGVNKNYSNIFDPASLAQNVFFLEDFLLGPPRDNGLPTPSLSQFTVNPDVFKQHLEDSTQLFFK